MDLLGIGIGPFNLSLAALLSQVGGINSRFFDGKKSFAWHPGLMLPESEIQVGHFKDLVTLVDPTNPYSFLAYLVKHTRLYRFMNCNFFYVLRYEFNDYMRWVSEQLNNLSFDEKVLEVDFVGNRFKTRTSKGFYFSKHLVLGNGLTPKIPAFIKPYLGADIFHGGEYLQHKVKDRVAIIGGGQSGAEIIQHLLSQETPPEEIYWVSSRGMLFPMDNSSFSTEYFHPSYGEYFYALPV
jgi:lysine N6-hydroxylase